MATREIYWSIAGHGWLYLPAAVALAVFCYGMWMRLRLVRLGSSGSLPSSGTRRFSALVVDGLLQRRFWSNVYGSLMHLFILWGMLMLAFGTLMVLFKADLGLSTYQGAFYLWLSLALDTLGLTAIVGVVMAVIRRYIVRPSRLDNRPEDLLVLVALLVVLVVGFALEGLRMAAVTDPWRAWSPVGWATSSLFSGLSVGTIETTYVVLWWCHLLTACLLIAIVPFTKLVHLATSPANQMSAADGTYKGRLTTVDFEDESKAMFGLGDVSELDRRARLSLEACTRCGRCQDVCPAYLTGKELTPKQVVLDLRGWLEAAQLSWRLRPTAVADGTTGSGPDGESVSGPSSVAHNVIWACTTCGACANTCPVRIEHAPLLVELRRYLVMMEGAVPPEGQLTLRNIETNYNPWGIGWADRAAWLTTGAGTTGPDQNGAPGGAPS